MRLVREQSDKIEQTPTQALHRCTGILWGAGCLKYGMVDAFAAESGRLSGCLSALIYGVAGLALHS